MQVEMQQILRRLPAERQTMLFSATHTPKVREIVVLDSDKRRKSNESESVM